MKTDTGGASMTPALTITPTGDRLVITANNAARALLKGQRGDYPGAVFDLFEQYACNGGYVLFDAGRGDPFAGLTSAPCIAESIDYDDDGRATIVGRVWVFTSYQTDSWVSALARGRAVFTLI